MPGKAFERYIFHVITYAYIFEMPKIRALLVSLSFIVQILITCYVF